MADPVDAHAQAEARLLFTELLGVLPPEMRRAVQLVYLDGLSSAEAAAVLGVAVGTVKSRCGRARTLMAQAAGERPR